MLVAPLMTPILGTAVSIVLTEPSRLLASVRTVAGGAAGAIAVGWFISLIASGGITATNIPGEVLGRTAPGLLDLGIASVLAAVVAVIPLAIHTSNVIEQEQFDRLVSRSVEQWDPRSSIIALDTETDGVWSVDFQISAAFDRSPTWQLADIITAQSGRPIDLNVRFVTEERAVAATR
jgi:hypothetical protein